MFRSQGLSDSIVLQHFYHEGIKNETLVSGRYEGPLTIRWGSGWSSRVIEIVPEGNLTTASIFSTWAAKHLTKLTS